MTTANFKIFIDGEAGTTGLQLRERLEGRDELELLHLGEGGRKDRGARAAALNEADIAILCLPDDAARESVSLIENGTTRVIDASTAHRVSDGWTYGFPEMSDKQTAAIAAARFVTNPGCYATGAVALLRPLVMEGLLSNGHPVTVNAISGYTGGGKALISRFEDASHAAPIASAHFAYGLGLEHKHVPEMRVHSGLAHRPLFVPSVGRFRQGMIVQLPLQLWSLPGTPSVTDIYEALADHYAGRQFVTVATEQATSDRLALLDPEEVNHTNELHLYVFGNSEGGQAVLVAVLDNLGKGASGQAVQNLNIMLGLDEAAGLAPGEPGR